MSDLLTSLDSAGFVFCYLLLSFVDLSPSTFGQRPVLDFSKFLNPYNLQSSQYTSLLHRNTKHEHVEEQTWKQTLSSLDSRLE